MKMRDGSQVYDSRLGRLVQFDERSRGYSARMLIPQEKKIRSYTWRCLEQLDQGREGACVGFGISHEFISRPVEACGLTNDAARALYWEAQRHDGWPGGSYPGARPRYEGTSVLAGVKAAQAAGWFDGYRWCFGLEDVLLTLGYYGPVVVGTVWLEGMRGTDANGYVKATGGSLGGHCWLIRGVNVKAKACLCKNSWGSSWGMNGDFLISWDDLERLLSMQGEAVTFVGRKLGSKLTSAGLRKRSAR